MKICSPLIIAMFVLLACGFKKAETARLTSTRYYQDIDINQLAGIGKLNNISYPCVEVEESGTKKIITYHLTKDHRTSFEYKNIGTLWVSQYEYKGDTSMIYSYEFILPNKVITFNYSTKETFRLMDVDIISEYKQTITYPIKGLVIEPKIENLDFVMKKQASLFINEFRVVNSVLVQSSVKIGKKGETIFNNTKCYRIQKYSMMWLLHFGRYLQEVGC